MAGISNRLAATLDWARAIAACYVVLHHVAGANGWSHGVGLVFRFGQEAVLVFFLLSGFVIFANEKDRAIRPKGYFLRRLRRIYPPLIVAILGSTLIAYLNHDISDKFSQSELWGTIFGLQDISALKPGVIVAPYLGNAPLWSLSYEIFFYLGLSICIVSMAKVSKWCKSCSWSDLHSFIHSIRGASKPFFIGWILFFGLMGRSHGSECLRKW